MADGQFGTKAVLLPILRSQHNARPDGVPRLLDGDRLAVQNELAALLGVHPEDGPGGLGAPRAHQTGKAHDLSLVKIKTYIPDHPPGVEVFDLKDLLPLGAGHPGKLLFNFPAHHVGDDLVHGGVLEVHGGDVLAVPHDADPVHNMLKLLQAVGDVDDAVAVGLKLADDAEQFVNFLGG